MNTQLEHSVNIWWIRSQECNSYSAIGWLMVIETLGENRSKANTWGMCRPNNSNMPQAFNRQRPLLLWPWNFQLHPIQHGPSATAAQKRKQAVYTAYLTQQLNIIEQSIFVRAVWENSKSMNHGNNCGKFGVCLKKSYIL